jgi:hypothetical protein
VEAQSSYFGYYFVEGLLSQMGWPRRRSLISSKAIVDSLVLDGAISQMIDWAASIGACRPDLALRMIATMFRANDWNSEDSLSIQTAVNDNKELWHERGDSDPLEVVKPFRFSEKRKLVNAKDLNDTKMRFALETYCFESLIWGLANPGSFKEYFESKNERHSDRMQLYKKMDLDMESIPTLDQTLESGEKILSGYAKNVGILSPIPQRLIEDARSLGIEVTA